MLLLSPCRRFAWRTLEKSAHTDLKLAASGTTPSFPGEPPADWLRRHVSASATTIPRSRPRTTAVTTHASRFPVTSPLPTRPASPCCPAAGMQSQHSTGMPDRSLLHGRSCSGHGCPTAACKSILARSSNATTYRLLPLSLAALSSASFACLSYLSRHHPQGLLRAQTVANRISHPLPPVDMQAAATSLNGRTTP
jgi:hypothetical protein